MFIVGVSAGFVAGVVDIGAEWMTDLREGVCMNQFWFNKEACCWDNSAKFGTDNCQQWRTWADLFSISTDSKTSFYIMNYSFYILSSFTFAGLTVALVRFFAPYACGSGIPEVLILDPQCLSNLSTFFKLCLFRGPLVNDPLFKIIIVIYCTHFHY